jgi:hypothetical protein
MSRRLWRFFASDQVIASTWGVLTAWNTPPSSIGHQTSSAPARAASASTCVDAR